MSGRERAGSRGVIVIGASWGGLNALSIIAHALPADFALPLVIVQHRSKDHESLSTFGVLALGSKESLRFSKYEDCYEALSPSDKIYRKVK